MRYLLRNIKVKPVRFFLSKRFIQSSSSVGSNNIHQYERNELIDDTMKARTHKNLSYSSTTSDYHLVPDTIKELIDKRSEDSADKLVYGFPHQGGRNLTFGELKQRVNTISQNMLKMGLNKGDRIALALPNTIELVCSFLAASEIGLVSVLLNPAYQLVEFEYMLKKTGAKALVIYDSFRVLNHMELMKKICPEIESSSPGELKSQRLPDLKHIFVLNSPLVPEKKTYKGTWSFDTLVKPSNGVVEYPYVDIDDPCLILFTSGTTGKPKGALMSHSNLLNSAYLSTVTPGKPDGLRRVCNPIPAFHIFGLSTGVLIPLLFSSRHFYILFGFFWLLTLSTIKAIQGYKCNTLRGTPTQFIDILNHPGRKQHDLSSLENIIVGGSTVPSDLLTKLREELKIKMFIIGYGMTETSLCHTVTTFQDEKKSFSYAFESVGRTLPFCESKIIDPKSGRMVPLNTDGELCVRGPHIIRGYWDEPEKSKETIDSNGWLKTGDIFSMDSNGYLFFKSRSKDVIIRGGANLYPAEIEAFLRTHSNIDDVQVFGVPDTRMGEEVCAWIIRKTTSSIGAEDIIKFCEGNISKFKIPKYIKFVDKFPINANNKVQKMLLREQAIKEYNLA